MKQRSLKSDLNQCWLMVGPVFFNMTIWSLTKWSVTKLVSDRMVILKKRRLQFISKRSPFFFKKTGRTGLFWPMTKWPLTMVFFSVKRPWSTMAFTNLQTLVTKVRTMLYLIAKSTKIKASMSIQSTIYRLKITVCV